MVEWSRGSWKDSVLVITHSKGERKKSCISRGMCWRGLVNPPFPRGFLLLKFKETFQVSLNAEASCGCDMDRETGWLSSSGQGCSVDAYELPNHTIWFTLPPPPLQNKQPTPLYSFPTIPGFGDSSNSGLCQ